MGNEKRDDATTGTETTPKRKFGGPQAGAGRPRGPQLDQGNRLAQWISDSGKSVRQVAAEWGVVYGTLNNVARGKNPPDLRHAVIIEKNTGIPCSYWVVL